MIKAIAVMLIGAGVLSSAEVEVKADGNRVSMSGLDGGVDLEWVRPTSFSVRRWWSQRPASRDPLTTETIEHRTEEKSSLLSSTSKFLVVELSKADFRLTVRTTGGRLLFSDVRGIEQTGDSLTLSQALTVDEAIMGISAGARFNSFNLRGQKLTTTRPFFLSTAGYGREFLVQSATTVDVAQSDSTRLILTFQRSAELEQYFYYGPAPKEVIEEHSTLLGVQPDLHQASLVIHNRRELPKEATPVDTQSACWIARDLGQLSLSAVLLPAIDVSRAAIPMDLTPMMPMLFRSDLLTDASTVTALRRRWIPYLNTYLREAHDRGLPVLRPLPMQFPLDKGLETRTDAIMIGDEVLAFPGCDVKKVGLPRGAWTDLRTNRRYAGRQMVDNAGDGTPIFAKSGSLIPLAPVERGQPHELHYYPSNGAEFFWYEEDVSAYSQFHAAPVGELMRLEAESQVPRVYKWVVHHLDPPRTVGETGLVYTQVAEPSALKPGAWHYDTAQKNLVVMMESAGKDDRIINITF